LNYDKSYSGAVPAKRALARSLNIPAVLMLHNYGQEKFLRLLQRMQLRHISNSADHYGLSLILGGAEASLWDVTSAYAAMARTLNNYSGVNGGAYADSDFDKPTYRRHAGAEPSEEEELHTAGLLNAGAIFLTFQALLEVNRPENEMGWEDYASTGKVAWKTGTSMGHKDAWAVGTTRDYVVGVWVGNADGEGRPGITGVSAAAPIMFDLFDLLPSSPWFATPYDDMVEIAVCKTSGHRALDICEQIDSVWVSKKGLKTGPCPYHQLVHLEGTGTYQTSSDCTDPSAMITKSWFMLPPVQEFYYKAKNPDYRVLPPFDPNCAGNAKSSPMEMIYPKRNMKLYVPIELDGTAGQTVFEVAHRIPNTTIYWHLDDQYLGSTYGLHQHGFRPTLGLHSLTLVDENGNTLTRSFEILND
jgi:penicillin-binding protein 1C